MDFSKIQGRYYVNLQFHFQPYISPITVKHRILSSVKPNYLHFIDVNWRHWRQPAVLARWTPMEIWGKDFLFIRSLVFLDSFPESRFVSPI